MITYRFLELKNTLSNNFVIIFIGRYQLKNIKLIANIFRKKVPILDRIRDIVHMINNLIILEFLMAIIKDSIGRKIIIKIFLIEELIIEIISI